MDPLLATLFLILLALVGARFSFTTQRVPPGPRLLFRTGMHWLVLGWLLGPGGIAVISQDALAGLYPLLALGLGWVGLLFGLQLDRTSLRQFPPAYHAVAVGQAVITFLLLFGIGWAGLGALDLHGGGAHALLLGAAATACVSTPAGIAMVSSNFLVRGNVRKLLFFIASVDALVGILALQLTYSLYSPTEVMVGLGARSPWLWLGLATGLGIVSGIILLWLLRPRPGREELVLFLLGIAALASGAALQLGLSPLFVCVAMGAVVANLAGDRQRVFQALERWEKPLYVILLLLAGALVRLESWWILPLAVCYAVIRGLAKVAASAAMVSAIRLSFETPRRLGLGLVPQGGISLAMAISVVITYSGTAGGGPADGVSLLFATVVAGVALSELVGPFATTQVLRRAGEISPLVERAIEEGDEEKAEAAAIRHTGPGEGPEGAPS